MIPKTAIGRILATLFGLMAVGVLSSLCGACVTAGEMDGLRAQVREVREVVNEGLLDCERLGLLEGELARTEEQTAALAQEARERGWSTFDRVVGVVLGVAGLGLTGYGSYKATNMHRDRVRALRGEPVAVPGKGKA